MRTLLLATTLALATAANVYAASPAQPAAPAAASQQVVVIDVRTPEEFADGHLQGAQLLPVDRIAQDIAARVPDKHTPIQLYCRSGRRSAQALDTLKALGYTRLQNLGGLEDASHSSQRPIVR
jgi:phage shock protein E